MKTLKPFLTVILFMITATTSILYAQEKSDTVYMLNGETKEGKVTAIQENSIEFVYSGEDLTYELKKADVQKIVFGSGRTQIISQVASPTSNIGTTSAADRKNKLAVLPFTMVSNDQGLMSEAMSGQIQHAAINSFKKNTRQLMVQDPMTTNAILLKNNLDPNSIKTLMPQKVAEILGVEFVVYGTANISFEGTRSYGSSSTTYKDKTEKDKAKKEDKSSGKEFTSNSSSTTSNYDTSIELNIFSDSGSNLYSVSRNAFGSSLDTYDGTLNYLIKRCPWGSKNK
ncbi:hypothetical protein [Zunongwangia sp. HRR-M8]|uniref:hypothetical protein n=1 Tax=Zunongwangia sp. HRR-M8 TaxID=3015170 RepID=UPI0022DCEE68|nr:hypothetical protein [Zunongwangia sp. HRR-M8]WBL23530.1 hypothetical protein PBT89_06110 [Zunongwangia sp. HRR-M8]